MDIMVDLETLGIGNDAVVISIGACQFDIEKKSIGSTFYMALDIQDQLNKGRKIDASTLKWWFSQSNAAQKIFHEKAKPSEEVLKTFAIWLGQLTNKKDRKVWGNGSTFDISIMEDLLATFNIETPWMFSSVMDLRTFRRFIGKGAKVENMGVSHHALDDAVAQAKYVILQCNPPMEIVPRPGA